ncbi:hypothetical protein, partial [Lentilactobacillus rapi]|uniref:hypothetical protein n=1 Tax=Lentilactobacillus rapi TaxID=481723 RepID=UPI001FB4B4C5
GILTEGAYEEVSALWSIIQLRSQVLMRKLLLDGASFSNVANNFTSRGGTHFGNIFSANY